MLFTSAELDYKHRLMVQNQTNHFLAADKNTTKFNKISHLLVDYWQSNPVHSSTILGGLTIGSLMGCFVYSFTGSNTVTVLGTTIGVFAGQVLFKKMESQIVVNKLILSQSQYCPLPNFFVVDKEMNTYREKIKNNDFNAIKNLILDKIDVLDERSSSENCYYQRVTFPLVIKELLNEETRDNIIDLMSNLEVRRLLNMMMTYFVRGFKAHPTLNLETIIIQIYRTLSRSKKISANMVKIYLQANHRNLSNISFVYFLSSTSFEIAFNFLQKLYAQATLEDCEVLIKTIYQRLTSYESELKLLDSDTIYKFKEFISEIIQVGSLDNKNDESVKMLEEMDHMLYQSLNCETKKAFE